MLTISRFSALAVFVASIVTGAGIRAESENAAVIPTYRHYVDKSTGFTVDEVEGTFELETPPFDPANHFLNFTLKRRKNGKFSTPFYRLTLAYTGAAPLQIGIGPTLMFALAEDVQLRLKGAGSLGARKMDMSSGRYSEVFSYDITVEQLARLASCGNVAFLLEGEKQSERGFLQQIYSWRIREFLSLFAGRFTPLNPPESSPHFVPRSELDNWYKGQGLRAGKA